METNERASHIIKDLMAVPKDSWVRVEQGGQPYFEAVGRAGVCLYFSRSLLDGETDDPRRDEAIQLYLDRLGDRDYAVEFFDEEHKCVCLLRFNDLDEIEVAEYESGKWETLAFGLPPAENAFRPVLH